MRKLYQERKGVALLTVVLFFLVMVILLGGLLFATVSNLRNTQTAQKHTSVYYAAESGINLQIAKFLDLFETAKANNWTISYLENQIIALRNAINSTDGQVSMKDNLGNPTSATVLMTGPHSDASYPDYTFFSIQSTGTVGGVQRTLTTNIGYEYVLGSGPLLPISGAIVVNSGINVQNGNVVGSIATNLDDSSTIYMRTVNCSLIPQFTVPTLGASPCPAKEVLMSEDKHIVFSDIVLPLYPTAADLSNRYTLATMNSNTITLADPGLKDGYYISNISPTGTLTINLGNWMDPLEYVKLRVTGTMNFNQRINVTGTGRVMLLLDHNSGVTISGQINPTSNDPAKIMLVFKSNITSQSLTIANNNIVVASILSDSKANVSWNQAQFFGFFATNAGYNDYTGQVSISANSDIGSGSRPPIWIYAPYANVNLQGNANFYGTVMANSYSMNSNQTTLTYKALDTGYPFSEWTVLPGVPSGEMAPSEIEYRITPIKEN